MRIGILRNESIDSADKWVIACIKRGLEYDVIDLSSNNWFPLIKDGRYDLLLSRPPGLSEDFKNLYDERLYIIAKVLNYPIFPSFDECLIYENKKLLSDYLKAKEIPHAQTHVFYNKKDALNFVNESEFPIVAKMSIGASGSGVIIMKNPKAAIKYINKAFSGGGIHSQAGPNRVIGSPKKWFYKALKSPSFFIKKLKHYYTVYKSRQRNFVILQEYVPHDFEWRAVKIGESFFAHKKIKFKEKASGSKGIDYSNPPMNVLNFARELCENNNFNCMAIDFFEDGKGGFLVNELQTLFGHVQDYILSIDGVPGRYIYKDDQWNFEAGDFNTNESYDLRLSAALDLYHRNEI
jgi:glutathione synthase/RimK-type ligase-like ATP-grasp enzyme